MNSPDVFGLVGMYADKHQSKVLLAFHGDHGWQVTLKGDTKEQAFGASPLEAYTRLAEKLQLVEA